MRPLVILGTGLAGYTLAREFRKLNNERPLIILSQDDGRSYSKPMLSNALAKGKTPDELAMASPEKVAEQLKAEVRVASAVSNIDPVAKTLTVNGESLAYEDLVLAVGADVFRPPLGGDAGDSVLSVNDLGDYAIFREQLGESAKRVLIIGGGLIGCEFANDLAASGNGIRVSLADGRHAEADIVLSAIGLRPRLGLAEVAGLNVARGICVDRYLRTSNANIYAIGDCAEVDGKVLMYVLPLMASARALAKTLAGEDTVVSYPAMPVQIKTPICPIVVSPVAPNTEGAWAVEADGNNVKASFLAKDGQLLGFALTGSFASDMKTKMEMARALPPILA
jgi:rubredoxin-NAD+ reductase